MGLVKKLGRAVTAFAPPPAKSDDGRDQWPSRTAFVLASCGGAIGMGNMLRFPSQVYNNHGLQWFLPYLIAVFIIAIPCMMLEIAIGQAYRGGCVIAFNNMNHRLKGTGMGLIYVGFIVVIYFVPILAWVMVYFRASFQSPLPWTNRTNEFYMGDVIANPDPIPGKIVAGHVESYTKYPGTGMVAETTWWNLFTWFVVWLCMFRGVGLTGRVVYFTMGLPIIMAIILIGRSVSLPNAKEGIKLYFAQWNSDQLSSGKIWQTACGQVFFSTGVGFGYYSAYASYNRKFSNAVQDAVTIVCCNCSFEVLAAFAVFGVIGFLEMYPEENSNIGSFTIGFLTYPAAITQMPGANFWAVLFFFTLMLLGISSSFAMLDAVVTLVMDSEWTGKETRWTRPIVTTTLVTISFLLSLMYCSEFGFYLLDGVDMWLNNVTLVFVVWTECVASTTIYRYKDVVAMVGWPAFGVWNVGYFGGMIGGVAMGHGVRPAAGAGFGFGIFILCTVVALVIARIPDAKAPKFLNSNGYLRKLWYLGFYSGNQLRLDLNIIVGSGKNWNIPFFWAPLLKYVSGPILAIIFSFAYPQFQGKKQDPVYIFGFIIAHFGMILVFLGLLVPRFFDVFVPKDRRHEGHKEYSVNVLMDTIEAECDDRMEKGDESGASDKVETASKD